MRNFGTSCPKTKGVLSVVIIMLVAAAGAALDPGTWTAREDLPERLYFVAIAEVDGIIYTLGGSPDTGAVDTVYAYNPVIDQWMSKTSMSWPRAAAAAAVVDGRIYVIGGGAVNGLAGSKFVDTYDPDLFTYWTEVAAHLQGAYGSLWRTDVCALNLSGEAANIELVLHTDTEDIHREYSIDPSQQKSFGDVVGDMGIEGKGALEFRSDQHLRMAGRTFSEDDTGTFGQFCDFRTMDDGFSTGNVAYLIGLHQEEGLFRTNLIFANTGIRDATVVVELFKCDGTSPVSLIYFLEPGTLVQSIEPFANEGGEPNLGWGYATVKVVTGAGVRISASVIDSRTNDATTIVAQR